MLQLQAWGPSSRENDIDLYYVELDTGEDIMKTFTLKDGVSVNDVTRMSYSYRDRQMTEKLKSFHRYIKEDLCLKKAPRT